MGAAILLSSVEMLEGMAPDYLSQLNTFIEHQSKEAIVEEAHKIKGAAGSVGLKRAQQLAQQIQSPNLPEWEQQLLGWAADLNHYLPQDLKELRLWLEQRL